MSPNSRVHERRVFVESKLVSLLGNTQGLNALVDYLEILIAESEELYNVAAKKAVFNPDNRADALYKCGMIAGITQVRDLLLRTAQVTQNRK